jgi:hypothetical protein
MRISQKAFLSCIVVAGIGLLAAPAAMATGGSCSPTIWTIEVVPPGACRVNDPAEPECGDVGEYTGIQYKLSGTGADHVSTLVTIDNVVSLASGNTVYSTLSCKGDTVTGLGKYSCHEQAVRFNPAIYKQPGGGLVPTDRFLWIIVSGNKQPILTSIAVKKGSCVQPYAVLGLGVDAPAASVTETLQHGACTVEFTLNALTGTVLSAKLTQDSLDAGCNLRIDDVEEGNVTVRINNVDLPIKFGQGYFQSGDTSCTTRVIGGKLYSWGSPCPP